MVERPTWAAALKASFVLQGFVLDLDDQFACEMCAVVLSQLGLARFGLAQQQFDQIGQAKPNQTVAYSLSHGSSGLSPFE